MITLTGEYDTFILKSKEKINIRKYQSVIDTRYEINTDHDICQ